MSFLPHIVILLIWILVGILLVVSRAFYTLVEDIVSEFRSSVTDWKNSVKLVTLPSTDRGILDALAVLSPEISVGGLKAKRFSCFIATVRRRIGFFCYLRIRSELCL